MSEKGFIQIPLLVWVIVSLIIGTGVVLYKQGKLKPTANISESIIKEQSIFTPTIKPNLEFSPIDEPDSTSDKTPASTSSLTPSPTPTLSSTPTPTPAPTSIPILTPAPTPTPTPSPTQTPTPAPTPILTPAPPEISGATAIIGYVVDGDTVELRSRERVRLIGINTPEIGQPYSSEAKNKLKELIEGKEVKIEKDITDRDQYDRLLRYIWLGDVLINLEMVRLGYANSYTYPPDVKYQDQIVAAEKEARERKIGLWVPAEASSCINVSYMHADAAGNDNYNLNDEYVIFKNTCSQKFDITGWTVKDEATHIFTFPSFYLASQATATLYSGSGTNATDRLYWNRADERYAIWNNTGDTVYLRSTQGNLVLEYSY